MTRTLSVVWTSERDEVPQQREPQPLTLLGMKLRSHHGVAPDDRRELAIARGSREYVRLPAGDEVIAVDEVEVASGGDPRQHTVVVRGIDLVPADVRHPLPVSRGIELDDAA